MKKAKKITGILFWFTLACGLIYMAIGIYSLATSPLTSFPWWSACVFAGIYFGPILLIEAVVYGILRLREKKAQQ